MADLERKKKVIWKKVNELRGSEQNRKQKEG